ncbi:MAG TPA: hypothetical protein VFM10_02595 [Terriglobales bacterium]|nr:hypothetical protein [Terriglobales bacterium]
MGLLQKLWPWGQLIDMERSTAQAEQRALTAERERDYWREQFNTATRELRHTKSVLDWTEAALYEQQRLLQSAHFRNPNTGRIGPKGRIYSAAN